MAIKRSRKGTSLSLAGPLLMVTFFGGFVSFGGSPRTRSVPLPEKKSDPAIADESEVRVHDSFRDSC